MSEKEFRNEDAVLDIKDRPQAFHWVGLSLQHLFTMFGATVLVPILVGIDPGIALVSSGLGTMVYLITTKGKIPAYLGSSFAFIAAMQMLMKSDGYPAIAQGAMTTGLVYLIVSLIIKKIGSDWLDKILPPIVVGPVVMVIGLGLAANAANNAMYNNNVYDFKYIAVALITLGLTIFYNMFFKGFLGLIPILLGIVSGYLVALAFGIIDLTPIKEAAWFALPTFEVPFVQYQPKLYLNAITTMAPIAFVTMTEHFGHVMVLNSLTGRDFFKDPGLDRTLTGDGLAQIIAGFFGAPPVTSYGETIGVMALNKIYSVYVIAGAAVIAIVMSFIGKISALLSSIPTPVIGGISIALFGVIASSGLKILVENKIDFDNKKNLLIASVILVSGIGGLTLQIAGLQITGVAFSTLLGIILYQILPEKD